MSSITRVGIPRRCVVAWSFVEKSVTITNDIAIEKICRLCKTSESPEGWYSSQTEPIHFCFTCGSRMQEPSIPIKKRKKRRLCIDHTNTRCVDCNTQETTKWRSASTKRVGIQVFRCNACGLAYSKQRSKEKKELDMQTSEIVSSLNNLEEADLLEKVTTNSLPATPFSTHQLAYGNNPNQPMQFHG